MMTEKDRTELDVIISKAIENQNTHINGHLEAISTALGYIKENGDKTYIQAQKTNGRVNVHDIELDRIKELYKNRGLTCPQKENVEMLLAERKNWKQKLIYNTVILVMAILASYVSIVTAGNMFKSDLKQVKNEIQADIEKNDKVQDAKIDSNKKTINDQAVENAFQKSLDDDDQ